MKPVVGSGLRTIAGGLDHPEGVCWSPEEGAVYAGGEAGQLYRFALDGGAVDIVATVPGGFLLGMAMDADRNVYACDPNSGYVMRISPDGDMQRHGERVGYPNYPVFDGSGNLWVTDSGAWDEVTGGLCGSPLTAPPSASPGRSRFANGLRHRRRPPLHGRVADAGRGADAADGRAVRARGGAHRTVPDGLAFDADGGLWIGCYQPNRIYRLAAGGDLEVVVDDWTGEYVMTPTNLAFAGDDLDVLVLASLCGWAVKSINPGRGRGGAAELELP